MTLALGLLSAVLLTLSAPRFGLTWLAPIALAPIVVAAAREGSGSKRFLTGWAAGAFYWGVTCYWIQFVLDVHGGMGFWGGSGAFLLFALYKGLHFGVFTTLMGPIIGRWYGIPAVAALWTGLERTHGELGFTWFQLGNAAIDMPVVLRIAPILGVYGISFAFALISCALAAAALRRPRRELAWLAILPATYLLPALPAPREGSQRALVVQPAITETTGWTWERVEQTVHRLVIRSLETPAPLILWPEVPAPFYFYNDPKFAEQARTLARTTHAFFLFGTVAYDEARAPLNSAVMLDSAGELVDRYDKIVLVPFGEFVPPFFGWINKITQEAGDYAPGSRRVVFRTGDHRTAAFICYESVFADLVREFTAQGAEVLANLSNDGYFGRSAAREQHLAIARLRAVENRRWILRATNDGFSVSIDPAGRIVDRLEPYKENSGLMQFNYEASVTPYVRYGDWFAWSCLATSLLLSLVIAARTFTRDG